MCWVFWEDGIRGLSWHPYWLLFQSYTLLKHMFCESTFIGNYICIIFVFRWGWGDKMSRTMYKCVFALLTSIPFFLVLFYCCCYYYYYYCYYYFSIRPYCMIKLDNNKLFYTLKWCELFVSPGDALIRHLSTCVRAPTPPPHTHARTHTYRHAHTHTHTQQKKRETKDPKSVLIAKPRQFSLLQKSSVGFANFWFFFILLNYLQDYHTHNLDVIPEVSKHISDVTISLITYQMWTRLI